MLNFIDNHTAEREGFVSVFGRDSDEDAGLPDFEISLAVNDHEMRAFLPLRHRLAGNGLETAFSQGFVDIVGDPFDEAAHIVGANSPDKAAFAAVFARSQFFEKFFRVERAIDDFKAQMHVQPPQTGGMSERL